jgi:hypothetical protein
MTDDHLLVVREIHADHETVTIEGELPDGQIASVTKDIPLTIPEDLRDNAVQLTKAELRTTMNQHDVIAHPSHYSATRFGTECITITSGMWCQPSNGMKYVWRHEDKNKPAEDLRKAMQYLEWAERSQDQVWVNTAAMLRCTDLLAEHVYPRLPKLPYVYRAIPDIANGHWGSARSIIREHLAGLE